MTNIFLIHSGLVCTLALVLASCGGAPKRVDALVQARAAYEQASRNTDVARHAPEELDEARKALGDAEYVWKKNEGKTRVQHYAYLASQRVLIAELIAKSKQAEFKLENMEKERQRVQLDLRAEEIERARVETLELQRQMADLKARETDRGMVLTLGDVLFDTGQASLKPGARRNIEQIAAFLAKYPERTAVIEGHTDSMGNDDYNMALSRERAFTVQRALIDLGVLPSRIATRGFGETLPVASNATAEGRQSNRRVDIVFPDDLSTISELDE